MNFNKNDITLVFLVFLFFPIGCQSCQTQRTFVIESSLMEENKTKIEEGNAVLQSALDNIVRQADSVMETPVHSVMQKPAVPPSGNKHDYLSRGTYWWPDPTKPKGIPYIRKDGNVNPEVSKIRDFHYMNELSEAIKILGVAYYYTSEEKYVADGLRRLRTWFLNSDTRMNPNLNHSQVIPGVSEGRKEGLIDTRSFVDLIDGVQLLSASESFTKNDLSGMKGWFSEFLNWMTTSEIGKGARMLENNIGTAYYMQLVTYALFTGNKSRALEALKGPIPELIETQFEQDGRQPKELSRTNAWSYSTANLNYWFRIARLAEHMNIDLWNYRTPSGKSIRTGYEWLLQYADNDREWTYQQIKGGDLNRAFSGIRSRASRKYNRLNTSKNESSNVIANSHESKSRSADAAQANQNAMMVLTEGQY
ncbi:alginate lyase family protein [Parapedobacter lycopersici]|uniref:alginate lyase family protein n=1 Tax=Parapedobacter lycopersici TaxID=1864939 RepID=UPI00214D195D|nr:alginate lyase family protein [Parapedobacter lycopersici]